MQANPASMQISSHQVAHSVSHHALESAEFKDFVRTLRGDFQPLSRQGIGRRLDKRLIECQEKVRQHLAGVLCACCVRFIGIIFCFFRLEIGGPVG